MTPLHAPNFETDDTVAILLEEVARLEQELQARDALLCSSAVDTVIPSDTQSEHALLERIDALEDDVRERDDTIALLLEQTRLVEEALEAQKAEWEQLSGWLDEIERRVEGTGVNDLASSTELRQAADLRDQYESESRTWEAQRQALEHEVSLLRGLAAEASRATGDGSQVEALMEENRRVHEALATLQRRTCSESSDAASLQERLSQARDEVASLRAELLRERDDHQRVVREHQVEVAALRSEAARANLAATTTSPATNDESAIEADRRIRAFREHLRELHDRDAAERASRTLAGRLSRLWHNTRPS